MSLTFLILAVTLSLASTNDYVYTKPQNIEIAGSAAFGSDGLVRGEDVAFALEAAKERRAALTYVSTNEEYDASAILASKFNEAVGIKTNLLNRFGNSAFIRSDSVLPTTVVLNSDDPFGSFVEAVGLVAMSNVSGVAVSSGSPLSKSAVAALPSGLDRMTRVAFYQQGTTDLSGYTHFWNTEYSGEPSKNFDPDTGALTPGELPQGGSGGDTVRGIQSNLGKKTISITGSRAWQKTWKSGYTTDGYFAWLPLSAAQTGPKFETSTVKDYVNSRAQCFCAGNAARDSAKGASVVKAYAVCSYVHYVGTEEVKTGTVAVDLFGATLDYSYSVPYWAYPPRVAIIANGLDATFDLTLEALGESVISESSVGGRIGVPPEPYGPATPPVPGYDTFDVTETSSGATESQEVHIDGFIIVLDFDFNAKTL